MSKLFNILGTVTLSAQSAVLLAVRGMPKVCLKLALVNGRFLKLRLDSSRSKNKFEHGFKGRILSVRVMNGVKIIPI